MLNSLEAEFRNLASGNVMDSFENPVGESIAIFTLLLSFDGDYDSLNEELF